MWFYGPISIKLQTRGKRWSFVISSDYRSQRQPCNWPTCYSWSRVSTWKQLNDLLPCVHVVGKKKKGKNQNAGREACVNLGQNNRAVKIHQDTWRSKAQNQDCPSSSWVNQGAWSPEDSDTHFKWNLPSQSFFANYCWWNWFVLQLFTFVFNLFSKICVLCNCKTRINTRIFNNYL